ncbi:MAG: RDD family protein [Niabella sp.]
MPVISIPTSFNIDVEFELPSFGRRMIALLIDMVIQVCYLIMASRIVSFIQKTNTWGFKDESHNLWAVNLLFMTPIFVYYIVMEITTNGQSLGKKLMKLRVVNINGGKASISQFMIRWLLRISDTWMVILLILLLSIMVGYGNYETIIVLIFGFLFLLTDIVLVITSKRSQRIGDMLANTILIKTNTKESLDNTVFREVEDDYVPAFKAVMRLSDKDLNIIKTILDTSRKTGNYAYARTASDKIKNFLQIQSDLEPEDFLDRLLKDYNYLSVK